MNTTDEFKEFDKTQICVLKVMVKTEVSKIKGKKFKKHHSQPGDTLDL